MIFSQDTTQLTQTAHLIQTKITLLDTLGKPSSGTPTPSGGAVQQPALSDGVAQLSGTATP